MKELRFPGGPVLLARRTELGLPRAAIAIATCRGEDVIRRWEAGTVRPSHDVIVRLAQELDIPVADLEV